MKKRNKKLKAFLESLHEHSIENIKFWDNLQRDIESQIFRIKTKGIKMKTYISIIISTIMLTGCATPSLKRTIAGNLRGILQSGDCNAACLGTCEVIKAKILQEADKLEGK